MEWSLSCNLVGRSPPFLRALAQIERYARSDATVLIFGETGTGKELAARALHYLSGRRGMPFVPINCGAIPDTLLESELFGYTRGAFTDARAPRKGLFRQAQGGTVFLDEIEALSPRGQVQLLRFLQDRVVRPVGSDDESAVDVRVVAASNVELEMLVERGGFRSDLLFRLDVLAIRLPSLAQRRDDIEAMSVHFLERFAREARIAPKRLAPEAIALLETAPWPGNIRQLENCLMRAQLLEDGEVIGREAIRRAHGGVDAPSRMPEGALTFREAKSRAIEHFEREFLSRLLESTHGNIAEAARLCRKERSSLSRLVAKHRPHLLQWIAA